MNQIDPKLIEAMEHVEKAQKIMTELGHTKYTICGLVSKQMLHDSELEVSALLGKLEAAEDALRDISLFLSCGGYNDVGLVEFDPAHYAKKIKEAIINDNKHLRVQELENFVRLAVNGKRSDGTYNYCREALEQQAKELLT